MGGKPKLLVSTLVRPARGVWQSHTGELGKVTRAPNGTRMRIPLPAYVRCTPAAERTPPGPHAQALRTPYTL